jgi:hypothetical protein
LKRNDAVGSHHIVVRHKIKLRGAEWGIYYNVVMMLTIFNRYICQIMIYITIYQISIVPFMSVIPRLFQYYFFYLIYFSDPPLDPKYLTKREDAIPLRGVSSTRSASPPVIHSGLGTHINSRLSQQQVVVPKAMHSQPPPLASAYFPGQKGS